MIRFDRVSKHYPLGKAALSSISLEIMAGEFVLINGHSGAGKSTLMKLVCAIEKPTGGRLTVAGQDVGSLKASAVPYLRRNMGLVFQDQRLLFDRNALDNVMLPLQIIGFSPLEAKQRAHAALDKVGLLNNAQSFPIALSGGEQQRLAIARAVVSRPSLLLADEPTAHLDEDTATDVARIFREFHRVGVTVLITTCDKTAFPHARRIALRAGELEPLIQLPT